MGSASAKIEQRFFVGSPAERYTFQHPQLSRSDRAALRDFWESSQGCAGAFTYAVPQEDGTTVNTTCCFENQPLTFQELTDTITSVGVTLVAIPDPASAPTYALASTVTRFPDATLNPALLQQVQEIIPLVRIRVLDSAVPDMFLSDRRVTIGTQLYLPRLLRIGEPGNEPLITQSIDGSSDDVTFAFGNADRVMVQVANDTQLRWARIELSLFHVATGYKLNLWAGYVIDWHSDAGPEFTLRASDILSALTLSSPAGNISRTCWRRYGQDGCPAVPGSQVMDTTHFPSSDNTKCDFGYNTPNGCMAHQVETSFGGCYATPQGVTIWNNQAASGGGLLRATSLISDTVFGATLPEIWHDDEGVTQWGLPVACKIVAGRDESDYYAALGIIGKGPLGALTAPGMWDSDGDGKKDTFIGSTLDGQPNHGYQVDSMGNLKPGANATFGYRYGLGSDPAGSHDYFSLSRVNWLPRGWYTNPTDGSPMEEIAYNSSAYNLVFVAGNAFLEIRRTDQAGVQPSLPDSHQLVARISKGLTAYTWTAPGSRGTAAGCTNPFWVAINTYLRAINQLTAAAATQETYFDVAAAVAASAIADTSVAKLFGTGTEKQFQFKGSIDQRYPTRDWLRLILANAAGYFTWSWGALKVGCRCNASSLSAFTSGNMLFNSLVIQPIKPTFEKLTMGFLDQEYLFASNTVDYLDQDYAARNGRLTNPFAQTINLTGTSSKSQAGRLAVIRGREELGGAVQSEQDAARLASFRTTILALETEAGMVVSVADADIPGGTGNFRIQSWRLNRDWSIDIQARSVTASMYDVTTGPKPTDVAAAPVPVDPLRDTGVADAPGFSVAIASVDPTEIEVYGLTFSDAANSHTVNAGTFTFYFCDPSAPTTTLAANLGSGDSSVTLTSAAGISSGDYLQIGQEIVLCGAPSGAVVPITRAQLGSTAATASSGDNAFRLSQRVLGATIPLDPANNTDTPNWHVLLSLPNMRVAAVGGKVTNHYGDSPVTNVCVTGNATDGLVLSGAPAAAPAPNASNLTAASVTVLYGLFGNASAYGFKINSITLPTTDPSYHQPKFVRPTVTFADGSTEEICSMQAGVTSYQGPIKYLQDGSSHTLTITWYVENEDGIITASPFTSTVTVQASGVSSATGREVTPLVLRADPNSRLVYTRVGFTPTMNGGQGDQNVTYYFSWDGSAFYWIGWDKEVTSGSTEIQFERVKPQTAQTGCVISCVAGAIGGDANKQLALADLPAGHVETPAFTIGALATPLATLITSLTVASGAGGSWPYNAVTPDGTQYFSIGSVGYNDASAVSDPNCFFIRITAQDLDSSHNTVGPEQQFAGTSVPCNNSNAYTSGPLMGNYGTAGVGYTRTGNVAYIRLRVYACNRVDQSPTSFSNPACATLQTGVGSGAGYVDVLVASGGSAPAGAIVGSRVTGTVANANYATSANSANTATTATNATNATNASYVPGSGIQGAITAGTGALTTIFQVKDAGSNIVCWMGQNGSNYGIWAANAWFGGTSPSNPKIWLDSSGNAWFTGTINSGSTITGASFSGGSLTITTSAGTVSINSATSGVSVVGGGVTIQVCTTGISISNGSQTSALFANGLNVSGYGCVDSGGQWIRAVNCPSYGVTASFGTFSGNVSCNTLSVSGSVSLSGTFSGTHSGSWSGTFSCSAVSCSGNGSFNSLTVGGYNGYSGTNNFGFKLNSTGEYIHIIKNGVDLGAVALDFAYGILYNVA